MKRPIFLGLGANLAGRAGAPASALRQCIAMLEYNGIGLRRASSLYVTTPVGGGRQPHYLNAVIEVTCSMPPARLLRVAKRTERDAGRRRNRTNGPRPLDIDILDFGGQVIGAPSVRRPHLVLPHPVLAHRRFVLIPLLEIAPAWHHPRLRRAGTSLLAGLSPASGAVQRILDSSWVSCDQRDLARAASSGALRTSAPGRLMRSTGHGSRSDLMTGRGNDRPTASFDVNGSAVVPA